VAPFAERFVHRGGVHRAGVDGALTVVASEDAAWIRGDGRESDGISHVRVVEEYAGPVFEGEPAEADRFAIAVHREGRYLVEILDEDGVFGSYRIGPSDFEGDGPVPGTVETGKVSHLRTLVTLLEETDDLAAAVIEERDGETEFGAGVQGRIESAHSDAEAALEAASAGEAERANSRLDRVVETLVAGGEVLQDPEREYSDVVIEVLEPRLRENRRLAERARRSNL
jgi:polyhydroxyalkanoate synthesis regulator phasin